MSSHLARWRHLAIIVVLIFGTPYLSLSQVKVAMAPHATEIENEAANIFNSAKGTIKALPPTQRATVISLIKQNVAALPKSTVTLGVFAHDPSQLLTVDPSNLSFEQKIVAVKAMIQATNQNTQQVVNPGIIPSVPTQQGLRNAANVLNQVVPGGGLLSANSLAPLLQKYQSIGRLLWTTPALLANGTPMWQLAGTVFVTSPGVVTTACHTLMAEGVQPLIDIRGSTITLRSDLVLRVEFGSTSQFQTMYPVSGIAAISGQTGCDVAQLKIDGADNIPPLEIAAKDTTATRILVVGYPLLSNYASYMCSLGDGGVTEQEFCAFHAANPSIAKVVSPGHVLSREVHDGVSVFTYDAPTDAGQSGSPVFDAATLDVIGIHYCCKGAPQNTSSLVCATWHPQNVAWNEAIASSTVVGDSLLKPYFSDVDQRIALSILIPSSGTERAVSPATARIWKPELQRNQR